ncbi:hypothetical protein E2C00_27340 [Streptomyces sp. WAC05374]|uniref:hypothetical protein n=1 Tax=Streptomyces sp. WAC05374 TaxID=2487420 RepID=UPI000F88051A|nr:hypothetical protein [Streptomyces sp. WAC05374]RST05734.1 hypothetical protein EF905_32850 [Streptomyces sp. WAC05374]TDF43234.1 hypothetical protein E2B92_20195 [Streptomyces sp. WAC05374]TDF51020.1 hypothetical protein E2C00_27340 [Streptomyces sp. WAC05374]TDF52237.1 hypothetical protein E2C02_21825 [Streptomyces sp. WAC05374]
MSYRYGTAARRAAAGVSAVALAVLLSACGGGDAGGGSGQEGKEPEKAGSASSAPADQPTSGADSGPTVPDTSKTLATINGSDGFQFIVHSAVRDEGGFLTVSGTLKNTTSELLVAKSQWSGTEVNVTRTGPSFGGVTLVEKTEKKRYYVLRDTEGYPLTTTGVTSVKAGESVAVFAQFPAPPANVTQVDLQIPLMPSATIEIS